MYQTQLLDNHKLAHLDYTADLLAAGEIVAFGFNGIFAFIGDADQALAARRIAEVKGQPYDKPLALDCAPEYLEEFVDLGAPIFRTHLFGQVQQLQRAARSLGVLLPAAKTGMPPYMTYNGNVLNVWSEYPPLSPIRYLQKKLRQKGGRALIGTSANQHGEPTYVDAQQVMRVFGGAIPAILNHTGSLIPVDRRQSATLIDLTAETPTLMRAGSLPVAELRALLREIGLRDLESEIVTSPALSAAK